MNLVPVTDLVLHPDLQMRASMNQQAIEIYSGVLLEGGDMPPIKAAKFDNRLYVVDGFHRLQPLLAVAKENSEVGAHVVVQAVASFDDCVRLAAAANSTNGVVRTKADFRKALSVCIRYGLAGDLTRDADPQARNEQIARVKALLECSKNMAYELLLEIWREQRRQRDAEIQAQASAGKSQRQIARQAGVDERTVRRILDDPKSAAPEPAPAEHDDIPSDPLAAKALWIWGRMGQLTETFSQITPTQCAARCDPNMREELKKTVPAAVTWLAELQRALR